MAHRLLLPFVFQVTISGIPAVSVSPPIGLVTTNGPLFSTVILISSLATAPPTELLSLTDTLKFNSLATAGKISNGFVILEARSLNFGKYLYETLVGGYDLKIGALASLAAADPTLPCVKLFLPSSSICSQQKVWVSVSVNWPFASR